MLRLIPIGQTIEENLEFSTHPDCRDSIYVVMEYYKIIGFNPPWIGYYAKLNDQLVGSAGYKGKPINNKIEIPDARIHYELDQGSQAAFSDIEVVTAAYRPKHLRAKEQAGFRAYASSSDRAAMSTRIEDEHHTLDWVLDL